MRNIERELREKKELHDKLDKILKLLEELLSERQKSKTTKKTN